MDKTKKQQQEHEEEQTQQTEVDETQEHEEENILEELETKVKEWESKYYRALADYQNLEKRVREERGDIIRLSNRELLLRFLPILDTLLLAQQHDTNPTFSVVTNQFLDTLKAEGAVKIKTVGEKFDPMTMEVVTTGEGKDGVVIQEVRSGYLLHDKLLRPAQVIVGNGEKEKE